MDKKIVSKLAYIGLIGLLLVSFYYSVYRQWDVRIAVVFYASVALIVIYLVLHVSVIRKFLKTRSARHGSVAGGMLLLVLGILILGNFLNFRHHRRLDLTENQLYSLSDQSRKVVQNLESEVEIVGFFRTESGRVGFEDLMQEYSYAAQKLSYLAVDPEEDPGRASLHGVTRNGQLVVISGVKKKILDDYSEEKITNAIVKVTREEEKVVYFLWGHGERGIEDTQAEGYSVARDAIEKQNYRVSKYNLAQENKLPEDASVIVSAGPKVNFFPHEEELIRKFLALGGKFLLLVDPNVDFGMDEFLGEFGLALDRRVVIDASGLGQLFGLGAAAPLVAEYTDHPITQELQGVMTFFPMAQSIKTSESELGYSSVGFIKSSARSWAETDLTEDRASYDESQDVMGPLELAAVSTLSINQPAKETMVSEDQSEKELGNEVSEEREDLGQKDARFVLYGDSDFASNAYFSGGANGDLFLMTVGWLAEESDLLSLRPRNPENRRIELTLSQSRLIFWATVVMLPLLTIVLGLGIWHRRR